MSWKNVARVGLFVVAWGILANLKDVKRYYRISTM